MLSHILFRTFFEFTDPANNISQKVDLLCNHPKVEGKCKIKLPPLPLLLYVCVFFFDQGLRTSRLLFLYISISWIDISAGNVITTSFPFSYLTWYVCHTYTLTPTRFDGTEFLSVSSMCLFRLQFLHCKHTTWNGNIPLFYLGFSLGG